MSTLKGDLAKTINSGKTPYEVRLEVLHLAQHIVENKAERELQYLHTQNEMFRDSFLTPFPTEKDTSAEYNRLKLMETVKLNVTQMEKPALGVEEVLNIAKQLNKFISEG